MLKDPRLLIIGGTGRKSGKSTLAEHLISRFPGRGINGIKVTSHPHPEMSGLALVDEGPGFKIYKEENDRSGKDTARMLKAGSTEVYLVASDGGPLREAWQALQQLIPENAPVICESPSLRRFIEPGLFVILNPVTIPDSGRKSIDDLLPMADLIMMPGDTVKAELIDLDDNNKWYLKS